MKREAAKLAAALESLESQTATLEQAAVETTDLGALERLGARLAGLAVKARSVRADLAQAQATEAAAAEERRRLAEAQERAAQEAALRADIGNWREQWGGWWERARHVDDMARQLWADYETLQQAGRDFHQRALAMGSGADVNLEFPTDAELVNAMRAGASPLRFFAKRRV